MDIFEKGYVNYSGPLKKQAQGRVGAVLEVNKGAGDRGGASSINSLPLSFRPAAVRQPTQPQLSVTDRPGATTDPTAVATDPTILTQPQPPFMPPNPGVYPGDMGMAPVDNGGTMTQKQWITMGLVAGGGVAIFLLIRKYL